MCALYARVYICIPTYSGAHAYGGQRPITDFISIHLKHIFEARSLNEIRLLTESVRIPGRQLKISFYFCFYNNKNIGVNNQAKLLLGMLEI